MNESPRSDNAPNPKRSDLKTRVLTSVVLLPALVALVAYGHHALWGVLLAACALIALHEWFAMTAKHEPPSIRILLSVTAVAPFVPLYLFSGERALLTWPHADSLLWIMCAAFGLYAFFLIQIFRNFKTEYVAGTLNAAFAGALYIGFTFFVLALFKRDFPQYGNMWLFMLMAMTWGSDTGAYFVGRAFGKHPLAPRLSPKKTVEGAAGGLIAAVVAASLFKVFLMPDIGILGLLLLVCVANFLAQNGDLAESLVKRSCGVKDSGNIIPGHGGLLDRVDALIFSAPWVYLFAYFSQYGF